MEDITHIINNIVRIAHLKTHNQHGLQGTLEKLFDGLIVQLQEENQRRLVAMPISAQLRLLHVLKDRLQSIRRDQQYIRQQVQGYLQWYRQEAINLPKAAQKAIEHDLEESFQAGEVQTAECQRVLRQVEQVLGFARTG